MNPASLFTFWAFLIVVVLGGNGRLAIVVDHPAFRDEVLFWSVLVAIDALRIWGKGRG